MPRSQHPHPARRGVATSRSRRSPTGRCTRRFSRRPRTGCPSTWRNHRRHRSSSGLGSTPEPTLRVDRRLLGLGYGSEGLRLGDRDLAEPAPGTVLGQRLLETRRQGVVSRVRILERPEDRPHRLSQGRPPRRTSRRYPGRIAGERLLLRPRPVLSRRRRRDLEAGLLGEGATRVGLGPGPVDPPGGGLDLPGGVLGPHPGRPRNPLCTRASGAGGPQCRHRVSAVQPDLTPELRPALRRLRPAQCLL